MIVSRVKLEFSDACRALAGRPGERRRRVLERVAGRDEMKVLEMESMSLEALLYYVLVEAEA